MIYFLGVDFDSVQSAIAKLNLHVALSSLQNNSKPWNSTNFSSTLFSEATFYSDSVFWNHLILSSLSSGKTEGCDAIGKAFGDCLKLTRFTLQL